ncbi:hypothetical protein H3C61_01190 [Candidatus Gracilibacteria bacterium]|nr:hypothetical protein [Candidatus Gracilibacteria bacterium]
MKKNNSGISIVVGMGLTLLISLVSFTILSYIMPFLKTTSGVENATKSYYNAYAGVENSLYFIKNRSSLTTETGAIMPNTKTGTSYQTFSSGSIIPTPGFGNSEYSSGYNIISLTSPIQTEIGNNYITNFSNLNFEFKVPAFTGGSLTLNGSSTLSIINWILSSENNNLYASGSQITVDNINNNNFGNIENKNGLNLNTATNETFQTFYNNNCGISKSCLLKMAIIDDLTLTNGEKIPYLEYKLNFGNNKIPDRYTRIDAYGKSIGYQKYLQVKIPQETIDRAFDFTVFQ